MTTEALLAFSNGQMRHTNLPAPFPYLLRGHTGADFWRIMSGLDWAALIEYCTSTGLGLHNEMVACLEVSRGST